MAHEEHHHQTPQEAEAFYTGEGNRWSGNPNESVVRELQDLTPGRALDIGCGEGADVLWLAQQGWDVVGIDHAPTAVQRAKELIDAAVPDLPARVEVAGFPGFAGTDFDLLTCAYGQLPRSADTLSALRGSLRVGGTLLLVHHDFPDEDAEKTADIILPRWAAENLGEAFRVEKLEQATRTVTEGAGAHHMADVILVATRVS